MPSEITIASLIASGEQVGQDGNKHYENPFVRIDVDPDGLSRPETDAQAEEGATADTLYFPVQRVIDGLVLKLGLRYDEASPYIDKPTFTAVVCDEDGGEIDRLVQDHEDTYGAFDELADFLRYEIPETDLQAGDVKVLKLRLEVTLQQWHRTADGATGEELTELSAQRDLTIRIRPLAIGARLRITDLAASTTPLMWKQSVYWVLATVENQTDEPIRSNTVELTCYEGSGQARSMVLLSSEDDAMIEARGSGRFMTSGQGFQQTWAWTTETLGFLATTGPMSKTIGYQLVCRYGEERYEGSFSATVRVAQSKIDAANQSAVLGGKAIAAIALAYTNVVLAAATVAMPWISAGFLVLSIAFEIEGLVFTRQADDKKAAAFDPAEYDADYREAHDPDALCEPPEPRAEGVPEAFYRFREGTQRIRALSQSMLITRNRLLSALKEADRKAAELQASAAARLLTGIEEEVISLKRLLIEIERYDAEHPIVVDEDLFAQEVDALQAKGLPDAVKQRAQQKGFSPEQIGEAEQYLSSRRPEELRQENRAAPLCRAAYYAALDAQVDALEQAREIRRIAALRGNDVLRELLDQGLISPQELEQRRDRREEEQDYRLLEIEGIAHVYQQKLSRVGIRSTLQLLAAARKPSGRDRLARMTGISRKRILGWANRADLMRIRGIGGQYADLLERAGVDTVAELSSRNADRLRAALERCAARTRAVARLPGRDTIAVWIEEARRLPRMIAY